MTPNDIELVRLVGNAGPFVLLFAYLLTRVLNAWTEDRKRLDTVLERTHTALSDISASMNQLKGAIENLGDRLDDIERGHQRKM